jgi:cytochrome c551/c552
MKRWMNFLLLTCLLLGLLTIALSKVKSGKTIFINQQKCNRCHSVPTQGIEAKTRSDRLKGPDLVNLAGKYRAGWIGRYLKKKVEKNGKKHPTSFKGTDEELQALVDWLLEQKAEG